MVAAMVTALLASCPSVIRVCVIAGAVASPAPTVKA
jgi:hypothetical protein